MIDEELNFFENEFDKIKSTLNLIASRLGWAIFWLFLILLQMCDININYKTINNNQKQIMVEQQVE